MTMSENLALFMGITIESIS